MLVLAFAGLACAAGRAEILRVPSQYATIQAGIDAANPGDTVLVSDGVYRGEGNTNLQLAKAITIRSENGPGRCTIDMGGYGRAITIDVAGDGVRFEGFLLTQGDLKRFSGFESIGGAIWLKQGQAEIAHCAFVDNRATSGAAVAVEPTASAAIRGCDFRGNRSRQGAGVDCEGFATILNCRFVENEASDRGGAVHADAEVVVLNCVVARNRAEQASGLYLASSSSLVVNCTIVDNESTEYAGALQGYAVPVRNTILYGNGIEQIAGRPDVRFSNVQGGHEGRGNIDADPRFALGTDYHLTAGSPCIDRGLNDPFGGGLEPGDLEGVARIIDGDGNGHARVDMGAYEFAPAAPAFAISEQSLIFAAHVGDPSPEAGTLRLRNSGTGALKWEAATDAAWITVTPSTGRNTTDETEITVQLNTAGLERGTHAAVLRFQSQEAVNGPREILVVAHVSGVLRVPADYPSLQAANLHAIAGDEILLADGVYRGIENRYVWVMSDVAIRSENGPENCIFDFEGERHDFQLGRGLLEGVTVMNGRGLGGARGGALVTASGIIRDCVFIDNSADDGGAIWAHSTAASIIDCTFIGNRARQGGAIYSGLPTQNGGADLLVDGCTFIQNVADYYGGGAIRTESGSDNEARILRSRFVENSATNTYPGGGGIHAVTGRLVVSGCDFESNRADSGGAGGVLLEALTASIEDCTFRNNRLLDNMNGGSAIFARRVTDGLTIERCVIEDNAGSSAISLYSSEAAIRDCTIRGNTAERGGGGIFLAATPALVENCLIVGNMAALDGGGVLASGGSVLRNCLLAGNAAGRDGGGVYGDAAIIGCTITDNSAEGVADGVYLDGGAVTSSIIWNNGVQELFDKNGTAAVTWSDIGGGWPGEGNIDADPRFANPAAGDYHLSADSPCIDAGDPAAFGVGQVDLDGEPRVMGGRIDMGVDEFTARPFVAGDMNCDGARDAFDVEPFVAALTDPGGYGMAFPECNLLNADINGDGFVDAFDIQPFVALRSR